MSHKSATIECNPREAHILANANKFLMVINLGRGGQVRKHYDWFPAIEAEEDCRYYEKGASVYALGTSPEGLEGIAVLAATYRPGARGGWKLAEGFED